jgi:hypothetical protein
MAKPNPLLLALGIPAAVLVFVAFVLITRQGGKFAELPPFSPEAYRKDWATLQGNAYVFAGQVDRQLAYVEGSGRVLSVKPVDPAKGAGAVPIRVPAALDANFESGQRYNFKLRVRRDILEVEDLETF